MICEGLREEPRAADPWCVTLERLRGDVGGDGVERISTQSAFDVLGIARQTRGSPACKRLARIMSELGWKPVIVRDARGRYREAVRGYCRRST
jgi:hypothetical protein